VIFVSDRTDIRTVKLSPSQGLNTVVGHRTSPTCLCGLVRSGVGVVDPVAREWKLVCPSATRSGTPIHPLVPETPPRGCKAVIVIDLFLLSELRISAPQPGAGRGGGGVGARLSECIDAVTSGPYLNAFRSAHGAVWFVGAGWLLGNHLSAQLTV